MTLKVGDIVICHGWDICEGKKGFVESIVSDPKLQRSGILFTGTYSVYGLEDADFSKANKIYYGDFAGAELEETGKSMTKEDLEHYQKEHPDDKMLEEDIPIVIKNLGKELGRNDGARDMFQELEKFG